MTHFITSSNVLSITDSFNFLQYRTGMEQEEILRGFARRLNDVCDDMEVPRKGKNRQQTIAGIFSISQAGARKWLEGESLPSMTNAVRIADWGNVNVQWLLTGHGAKSGIDVKLPGMESMGLGEQFAVIYENASEPIKALLIGALKGAESTVIKQK